MQILQTLRTLIQLSFIVAMFYSLYMLENAIRYVIEITVICAIRSVGVIIIGAFMLRTTPAGEAFGEASAAAAAA